MADRVAVELVLFGDFVCDAASGDTESNAFTLIEFEDASEFSVFSRLGPGKTMKRWSTRFERGVSQTVDWAWRLTSEGGTSAFRRIFGDDEPSIHFLLVVGKDCHLSADDQKRLRWRAQNTSIAGFKMSCVTFDGVLAGLRRRLLYAAQAERW